MATSSASLPSVSPITQLRRDACCSLLWEGTNSSSGERAMAALIARCDPQEVIALAIELRTKHGIRHTSLFLLRELARKPEFLGMVRAALLEVALRADDVSEFLALLWRDGKCPVPNQIKRGLSEALLRFDAYQLAKYNRVGKKPISLRDVARLCHPKTSDPAKNELLRQLVKGELPIPQTRETMLSAAKTPNEVREGWKTLVEQKKLGALAFIRSLSSMRNAGLEDEWIKEHLAQVNPSKISPLNFFNAYRQASVFGPQIEALMLRCLEKYPKLPGTTLLVCDLSGSMNQGVSSTSSNYISRMDIACLLAVLAVEVCEKPILILTAGSDSKRTHKSEIYSPESQGFTLFQNIRGRAAHLGGGGIFTRQCLDWARKELQGYLVDRIMVFSDSQDMERSGLPVQPFGSHNYIINIAAGSQQVVFNSKTWTAEISGFSTSFLEWVQLYEGVDGSGPLEEAEAETEL